MSEVAVIKTSEGEMVLEFWPDVAPGHVENFKKLARQGFYDGTCFHRVIKGFMIQGGDPLTKDEANKSRWGTGGPGYQIKAEFNDKPHVRGVLSMARSNDPNSAGSQFFICHGDPRFLDKQYTAFGQLIKGDDVLEKIAHHANAAGRPSGQTHERGERQDRPARLGEVIRFCQPTRMRQVLHSRFRFMNQTDLANLLVSLGCPAEKSADMAAQLDKRARQLAAEKGRNYEEALAHLLSLMKQGWAAKEKGL